MFDHASSSSRRGSSFILAFVDRLDSRLHGNDVRAGYTFLIVAFPFAVTPSLIKNMPYDTVKDFQPVILAATSPNLLAVNPQVPIQEQIADHIRSQMSKWSRVVRDAGVKAE